MTQLMRRLPPGRKPTGPVVIDWAHPLTRGLISYSLVEAGGERELVGDSRVTTYGTTVQQVQPEGHIKEFGNTDSDYDSTASVDGDLDIDSGAKITFFCHGTVSQNSARQNLLNPYVDNSNYALLRFLSTGDGNGIQGFCRLGDSAVSVFHNSFGGVTIPSDGRQDFKIGWAQDYGAKTGRGAVDMEGTLGYTTNTGSRVNSGLVNAPWITRSGSTGTLAFDGGFYSRAWWTRALTEQELKSMNADPYQFLRSPF